METCNKVELKASGKIFVVRKLYLNQFDTILVMFEKSINLRDSGKFRFPITLKSDRIFRLILTILTVVASGGNGFTPLVARFFPQNIGTLYAYDFCQCY